MAKYDYYVSQVEYNSDNTHIAKLRVHEVDQSKNTFKTVGTIMTRPDVVDLMKKGGRFATIVKNDKEWSVGAALEIDPVTTDYLKTKKDKSTRDNLENLPKIQG